MQNTGEYAVGWFTLSLINAGLAQSKGRSGLGWWLGSLFIGPRNNDPSHQPKPLRPLDCAKPALMSESVNQPTAYSPVFCIDLKIPTVHFPVDYKSRE